MELYFGSVGVDGQFLWVVGRGWRYSLGGLGVCGHVLCVGGHGCGRVEVYFEWVGMDRNFL